MSIASNVTTTTRISDIKHEVEVKIDPGTVEENGSLFPSSMTIPFRPLWAYGFGDKVKVINLTRRKLRCKLFYACSHVGIIYNDNKKSMEFLMGHKNAIISTSSNCTGKWIVTADSNEDHSIVIWDSHDCIPVHTIFEPHKKYGIAMVCMSSDAKYVLSVGREVHPLAKIWVWTFGRQVEDGCYTILNSYGPIKDIKFCPSNNTYIALTFSEAVIFLTWENEELQEWIPDMTKVNTKHTGKFYVSTYMKNSHECFTATNAGWVIVWGISFYEIPFDSSSASNKKIYIKSIRLQKQPITCLESVDNLIVTGDCYGHIKFYDKKLKMLYWCKNFTLGGISTLAFNVKCDQGEIYMVADEASQFSQSMLEHRSYNQLVFAQYNVPKDRPEENEGNFLNRLPSDYTLDRKPFFIRDFVVVTAEGKVAYVDFLHNKVYSIESPPNAEILCIDTHSEKPLICLGYANGVICLFNYTHKLVCQEIIMNSKETYHEITSIQYSPHGIFLACGTNGGHIWFLDPTILLPQVKKPFIYEHSRVDFIKFSEDNKYLAYSDASMAVCLLKRMDNKSSHFPDWAFHGRYISHYKSITDLLFCSNDRLFSIAFDRCLVEYDVENSEPGKLDIKTRTTVLNSTFPISFTTYELSHRKNELFFLISATDYKYYIVNESGSCLERTILGPIMGIPVQLLKHAPHLQNTYILFSTDQYVGIQLLPLSGNPYKRVAMELHPGYISSFKLSNCGRYIFTHGSNDNVCLMWSVKYEAVDQLNILGGTELTPYYGLIEGGVNGWLFQEMKDLFYYMQILHDGEDSPLPRKTYELIASSELPNLLRAIGFFPSEEQLGNIIYEVKYYYSITSEGGEEEITFENFVKMYLNHRPVYKHLFTEIEWAFKTISYTGETPRRNFIDFLVTKGEAFTETSLNHCLSILMDLNKDPHEIGKGSDKLPEFVSLPMFTNEILGINYSEMMMDKSSDSFDSK